jgi:predicted HicB family RNase H-like nuclease
MALQELSDTFSQELNIYEAEFAELSKRDSEATQMIEGLNQALEQNESRSKILEKIADLEAEKETLREEYSGKLSTLRAMENRLVDLQTECERFKSTDQGKKYTNIQSEFCIDAERAEKEIQVLRDEIDFLRSLVEANENQIEDYQNAL